MARFEQSKRKVCSVCGRVFWPQKPWGRFCCGSCKQLAAYRRRQGLPISDVACPKRRRRRIFQKGEGNRD